MEFYHPFIVHFPIAIFCIAFLFQLLSIFFPSHITHKSILIMMLVGTITAILGAISGNGAASTVSSMYVNYDDFSEHQFFANWLVWTSIVFSIILVILDMKSINNKIITSLMILLLAVGAIVTGKHGHDLVYRYGLGTKIIHE